MSTNTKTKTLIECALMVALSTLLGYIPLFEMPMGGAITLCSMAPLTVASFRHGVKWGVGTGLVHGLLQMLLGLDNVMYCPTLLTMIGCIMLDYILAFGAMGLAGMFAGGFSNKSAGYAVGVVVTGLIRLACSFVSGVLIWGEYAPEGMPVWLYSLQYNSSYMLPEIVITAVAAVAVMKVLDKRFPARVG
jgi:thiamine transporter